jgi:hypothetical protein
MVPLQGINTNWWAPKWHLLMQQSSPSLAHDIPEGQRIFSHLSSVACRPAFTWLEALCTAPSLCLFEGAFHASHRQRVGGFNLAPGVPDAMCKLCAICSAPLSSISTEHALICHSSNALRVLHHDEISAAHCSGEVSHAAVSRTSLHSTLIALNKKAPTAICGTKMHGECPM